MHMTKELYFYLDKSSYFRVKLKRIKCELYTEPDMDQTWPEP